MGYNFVQLRYYGSEKISKIYHEVAPGMIFPEGIKVYKKQDDESYVELGQGFYESLVGTTGDYQYDLYDKKLAPGFSYYIKTENPNSWASCVIGFDPVYYAEEKNSASKEAFINGSAFAPYKKIVRLSIETIPGVLFSLNNSINEIMVGATGVYEVDLHGLFSHIFSIKINSSSMEQISNNDNAYLFIDIGYED